MARYAESAHVNSSFRTNESRWQAKNPDEDEMIDIFKKTQLQWRSNVVITAAWLRTDPLQWKKNLRVKYLRP